MVLIEATIKPFKLDDVKEALEELGAGGMTVTEIMQSSTKVRGRSFGGNAGSSDLVPKIKVEIVAPRIMAERIVEAILLHGNAGRAEDGRIVVEKVDATIRIRTGESDADALS
ncbi:MAG TPA: P-II family nitrogen regulator [Desulfomonilaceae bacterium]|nr:P-II family nitrogen regulator [Desulfomonilaceae bacterium]